MSKLVTSNSTYKSLSIKSNNTVQITIEKYQTKQFAFPVVLEFWSCRETGQLLRATECALLV